MHSVMSHELSITTLPSSIHAVRGHCWLYRASAAELAFEIVEGGTTRVSIIGWTLGFSPVQHRALEAHDNRK